MSTLHSVLRRSLPADAYAELEPDLRRLARRCSPQTGDIWQLGEDAESSPPRHLPVEPWGRRVDEIELSAAWRELDRIATEEGLVATGYERRLGDFARAEQMVRLFLFHPASATCTCPLAMSDGAARVLELHGTTEQRAGAFRHLTSRDPADAWTSGQWMTERTGGSDVSGTSTIARREGDQWRLFGHKWFASSPSSQVAMALARVDGGQGLSLFLVRLRDEQGALQGIRIERLKDKLGTRALPTAELTLQGAHAELVGEVGHGVRAISSMLSITRAYNATCAAAGMRYAVDRAREYAGQRDAFGALLLQLPAHRELLAELEVEATGAFHLAFHTALLLGRDECGTAREAESALLRLLVPMAKLYTGKQASAVASEVLECFGGAGYIEDTGIPRLLRDAQVLSIWEGTTNVLSLDILRAFWRSDTDPLGAWLAEVDRWATRAASDPALADGGRAVRQASRRIVTYARATLDAKDPEGAQAGARAFAFSLARTTIGALMLDHARWARAEGDPDAAHATEAARRWCRKDLSPLAGASPEERDEVAVLLGEVDESPGAGALPGSGESAEAAAAQEGGGLAGAEVFPGTGE
ncbi:MAG TPA: acyl-CoA dehydrogenase family protein [Gemmatimonadales bacterium]|nr:acyl-CoA dehydrogenase family protein [Gemmatimonadales bacterium]